MVSIIKLITKQYFKQIRIVLFFLLPLISSCASKQTDLNQIIIPPKLPKEFSSIPVETENPKLLALLSAEEKMKNISVGRDDPFLPPQAKGNQLFVPSSFKYYGQISTENTLNAFVSYQDKRGFLKEGDIGGVTTDLLPNDWVIVSLDTDTKVLKLGFQNRFIDVELFPED